MKKVEQFAQGDLASIQAGLKQAKARKIVFDPFGRAIERLVNLWRASDLSEWDLSVSDGSVAEEPSSAPPDRSLEIQYLKPEAPWYIAMTDEFLKAIQAIDRKLQGRILEAISYLSRSPTVPKGDTVKPLTGDLKGLWRYRLGDYRLVYQPNMDDKQVVLVAFTSRAEAYS